MYGALVLFESEFLHVVAISFTALILTELLMVALTVRTWHWLMVLAQVLSVLFYVCSLFFLNEYFGKPVRSHCLTVTRVAPEPHPLYMVTPPPLKHGAHRMRISLRVCSATTKNKSNL